MGSPAAALLVIDLQRLGGAPGYPPFAEPPRDEAEAAERAEYFQRLERIVLPNVRRLQDLFRAHRSGGMEVIHTRIQSMTADGRDRSRSHKALDLHAAPGSEEAEFLPQVAPVADEIVFNKTASGVFNATHIDYVLRNLGVRTLYVAGVFTNECVSTSVRDACDLGYEAILVEDACAGSAPPRHDAAIAALRDRYARIADTETVVSEVAELAAAAATG